MRSRDLLLGAADYDWITNYYTKWITGHEVQKTDRRWTKYVTKWTTKWTTEWTETVSTGGGGGGGGGGGDTVTGGHTPTAVGSPDNARQVYMWAATGLLDGAGQTYAEEYLASKSVGTKVTIGQLFAAHSELQAAARSADDPGRASAEWLAYYNSHPEMHTNLTYMQIATALMTGTYPWQSVDTLINGMKQQGNYYWTKTAEGVTDGGGGGGGGTTTVKKSRQTSQQTQRDTVRETIFKYYYWTYYQTSQATSRTTKWYTDVYSDTRMTGVDPNQRYNGHLLSQTYYDRNDESNTEYGYKGENDSPVPIISTNAYNPKIGSIPNRQAIDPNSNKWMESREDRQANQNMSKNVYSKNKNELLSSQSNKRNLQTYYVHNEEQETSSGVFGSLTQ